MRKKEKSTVTLVIGFSVCILGWAIRSTFIMHNYVNKPLGGSILTIGMLITAYAAYKLLTTNGKR